MPATVQLSAQTALQTSGPEPKRGEPVRVGLRSLIAAYGRLRSAGGTTTRPYDWGLMALVGLSGSQGAGGAP